MWGEKEAFTLKDGSGRGCYQQLFVASSFPLLLSDGQTYELTAATAAAASIWGRTNRQGRADQTTATPFKQQDHKVLSETAV